MKKLVLLVIAATFALSPAYAAHKKNMTKEEADAAAAAQQRDNSARLVRDSLPLFLPTWSLPIFFGTHMDDKLKKM